jgi:hypothetical protein
LRPHNGTVAEADTSFALSEFEFYQKPSHAKIPLELCSDYHGEREQWSLTSRGFDSANSVSIGIRCPETANKRERTT